MDSDTSRLVTTVALFFVSSITVLVGIQAFIVLKKLQEALTKANKILDQLDKASDSLTKPAALIAGAIKGIKDSSFLLKKILS